MRLSKPRAVVLLTGACPARRLPEMKWCPPCRKSFPILRYRAPTYRLGVQGDVIVEVTIDEQGNVVQTKLLQGIGYGIEQKVLSVLPRWHFRPASKDGVTVASQHIVYFHYPS